MSQHQVVLRVAPIKNSASLTGSAIHQQRGHASDQAHIDTARSVNNQVLFGTGDIVADVTSVVSKYKKAHKDTAECAEIILTANHKYFDEISPEWRKGVFTPKMKEWIDRNIRYLEKKYPGLASAVLHLDEQSPHIHAMVVPVATYNIKFRRGEKDVTRIAYNRVFGDDWSVINEARRLKNSELTKLGRLQTDYATEFADLGLRRGIRNNIAINVTPGQHINRINQKLPPLPKVKTVVPDPTKVEVIKESFGLETEHSKLKAKREAEKLKRLETGLKRIDVLESKNIELDIVKQLTANQNEALMHQSEIIKSLRDKVATLNNELQLEKEIIDSLRKTPMQEIADRLDYDGEIRWKGAIDMIKDLGQLTYSESVAWLHHEFGSEVTTAAAIENTMLKIKASIKAIEVNDVPRPATAAEAAKRLEMTRQLDALGADHYRVTLMGQSDDLISYNPGKNKGIDSSELFYSKEELLKQIPFLSRENRRGYNVFITPFSDSNHFLLIDDLSNDTLGKLKEAGFTPAVVVRSSPKSIQAVLVTDTEAQKTVLNATFKELNHQYGDPKIVAQIHPFRLAGFTNRKDKHKNENGLYPFVAVIEASRIICKKACEMLDYIAKMTSVLSVPHTKQSSIVVDKVLHQAVNIDVAIDPVNVLFAKSFYRSMEARYGDDIDYSRADWMLCNKLKERGVSNDQVAGVLLKYSPNIMQRHQHQQATDYASRTARNAYPMP